ncbi:MAG: hypothetical protein GY731_00400 [Gammaproteobacteria bacterium]|nr:hypothetical protein [Gammaproteobacteria bacterium]
MAQLQQLQLLHDQQHDRLLLRVSADEKTEFRFWLTRRLIKLLWPAMVKTLQSHKHIATQQSPAAKAAVMEFHQQQAVSKTDFATPYRDEAVNLPLGKEPMLVFRIQLKRAGNNGHVLCMFPSQGQGIELAMNEDTLHSFCALVIKTEKKADWGLNLQLMHTETQDTVRKNKRIERVH